MKKLFEKYDDEYLKFKNIPPKDRLSACPDVCGMLYLLKLLPENTNYSDLIIGAAHDVYWLNCPETLSDEDVLYLTRCGFHWSSECDCLASFA